MKKFIAKLTFVFFLLLTPYFLLHSVHAQSSDTGWRITSFNSDITLNRDTTANISETITADFGSFQKHGIYRTVPVSYRTKNNNTLNIRFHLISVTDSRGNPIRVSVSRVGDEAQLKIGDPDRTVSGKQIYVIRYSVSQVITRPAGQAEFYWNVTGNDWPVPIDSVKVNIASPQGGLLNAACFIGYYGSFSTDCGKNFNDSTAWFSATGLTPAYGFTVAAALDPNVFSFPSPAQKTFWFLQDNWLFGLPAAALLIMSVIYWKTGRDKKYKHLFDITGDIQTVGLFDYDVPVNVYGPPRDLTPGEVGVLVDEKVHPQDITATMIDLARRGFFKVTELPQKGIFAKPDFELSYQLGDESKLLDFEKSVLDMLFGDKRLRQTVKLSKLGEFETAFKNLQEAKEKLYVDLVKKGFFYTNPDHARRFWLILAGVCGFIGIAFMAVGDVLGSMAGWITGWLGTGLVLAIFAPFMPARTAKGRRALREALGLREWIRLGAWREKIHEKHNFFEEVLPFTIAFGLTGKFLAAFKDADLKDLTKNMSWYRGQGSFSAVNFSSSFNSFTRSTANTVAWSLPQSASRGGSAFSGGGGFSGGGFGGGGGGSW